MATEESKAVPVKIEKHSERAKKDLREKMCATCGRIFALEPGQKFFDCPACYQKKIYRQKPSNPFEAKVISQIQCASCGAVEFVRFVPEDPKTVLCRSCFVHQAREQKKQK